MNRRHLIGRALGLFMGLPLVLALGMGDPIIAPYSLYIAPVSLVILVARGLGLSTLVVVAAATLSAFGPRAVGRALRFACVGASATPLDRDDRRRDAEVLGLAARITLAMALLRGCASTVSHLVALNALIHGDSSSLRAPVGHPSEWTLMPIAALVVGHLWLGSAARAAQRAAGDDDAPSPLGGWSGIAVLVFLLQPVQMLAFMFVRLQ